MLPKQTNARVTVVIPTYNYGRFLGRTLESVLAQTYEDWECFVVDDGSTDNTREIAEAYASKDQRIKYIYQENQRAGAARNAALRASSGEYLQFLDGDDLIQAQKFEKQVAFLDQHPEVDIVYGAVRAFNDDEATTGLTNDFGEESRWMPQINGSGKAAVIELVKLPLLIHAPLLRRNVKGSMIWFDEKLRACEDWMFWVQCALQGRRFHYEKIEGTLGFYRRHKTSACEDRPLVDSETRKLRKELGRIIEDPEGRKLNQRLAAEYEGDLAVKAMAAGQVGTAVWQLVRAGFISPGVTEKLKWFFCAAIAPFSPHEGFANVLATPATDTMSNILRNRTHKTS